jgi:CubicO group peptidase (beta-lactamase class C family)
VYHQAFGYHTYERERPVLKNDLYDLASLTKVAATTLASMRLYEEHKLDLRAPLGTYFKDLTFMPSPYKVFDTVARAEAGIDSLGFITEARAETDSVAQDSFELVGRWVYPEQIPRRSKVFDIPLRNLLTHTSGLQASLPIHTFQGRGTQELYSRSYEQAYTIPVAERLYLRDTYLDSLWNVTKGLHRDSARYRYSCVNMILMQQAIDSINQRPISEYISETFYQPMGLQTLCYNPRELFEEKRLVPTASDRWRGQILCGTVHDPTAALLGGVSGNAGLFSNANDLAILFQMMLNGGTYGGKRYLADSTIDLFTARQSGHRGFGFDKPPRNSDYLIAPSASAASYGHTGFTGTCVWVDPEHDLVYVFLSNRIHPSVKNYRINEMKIRQRVHQVIYNSLGIPPRFVPRPIPIAPVEAEVFLAANE